MKNLLSKIKTVKKQESMLMVETLNYQKMLYEQTMYWKSAIGPMGFTI